MLLIVDCMHALIVFLLTIIVVHTTRSYITEISQNMRIKNLLPADYNSGSPLADPFYVIVLKVQKS